MKTLTTESIKQLTDDELSTVSGGSFWEPDICGGNRIDIYRAGITYVNCAFGDDEYYIGSKRISKDQADKLSLRAKAIWKDQYQPSADMVGFFKEWKKILMDDYSIAWDGRMGQYKVQVF